MTSLTNTRKYILRMNALIAILAIWGTVGISAAHAFIVNWAPVSIYEGTELSIHITNLEEVEISVNWEFIGRDGAIVKEGTEEIPPGYIGSIVLTYEELNTGRNSGERNTVRAVLEAVLVVVEDPNEYDPDEFVARYELYDSRTNQTIAIGNQDVVPNVLSR